MNYLAHSLRFLDDPYRLAGACLPDWLRVIDRRARIRPEQLHGVTHPDEVDRALAEGVHAHHHDDHRFHTHPAADALTEVAVLRVRALSTDPRFRASTIGHVLVEMLLDSAILEEEPSAGERYYAAVRAVSAERLGLFARTHSGRELVQLQTLLDRFARARFILDYVEDDGVVGAMDGVLWRTGLPPTPAGFAEVVRALRPEVRALRDTLRHDGIIARR